MGSDLECRRGIFWRRGEPLFIVAADYQYYRDRREDWVDRLTKLKAAGINTVTFYIPWRHHLRLDRGERRYDFTGRTRDNRDLVGFIEGVEALGLFMIAKPGPFVHSELNIGGLPDLVSPTYDPRMPAARGHDGEPLVWEFDGTVLPAPFDEGFDALVHEWLRAVHEILVPFVGPDGPLIALQLNDETIYCTSNDPPWSLGYESSGMREYHRQLAERYGDIDTYNDLHGTSFPSFDRVPGPQLPSPPDGAPGPGRREEVLQYIDWAEYQWRLRRDLYRRYAGYLDIDLPLLTNFAGITPPIEENLPDRPAPARQPIPDEFQPTRSAPKGREEPEFAGLYPEWWFAMNRVDRDADLYHFGIISWLGVAAYDREVFNRYFNTARRARGINMEENWGFAKLYDERSKYPIIPFFQTLVSVAGGSTGYTIYCGASHSTWDDDLDRITKRGSPTFPSDAPISETGELRPMYHSARLLNRWFAENGSALLRCAPEVDVGYLIYAPYAAVSSWIPDARYWNVEGHAIPRCGRYGFEELARSLQEEGYIFAMFEVEAATEVQMRSCHALAIHSAFFMEEPAQAKLARYIRSGGRLFISGELPVVDLQWRPCTTLKDAVLRACSSGDEQVQVRGGSFFTDGRFSDVLAAAGIRQKVRFAEGMQACVHRGGDEYFVFFFNFDRTGSHEKWIEFYGQRVDLLLGAKTCGVLRILEGRLVSYVVKGENELEGVTSEIRIRFGDQVVAGTGDFSSCEGA